VLRPFNTRHSREILSTPLVYGFDTGFVAWSQGLHEISPKDRGFFWEHLVLNELKARLQDEDILCWRDKQGREVDFVRRRRGKPPVAIEAKWSASAFDPAGIKAFRTLHPGSENIVVANDIIQPYTREVSGLLIRFCPLDQVAD
jgi:predicted AAA+ superfamily ATPase